MCEDDNGGGCDLEPLSSREQIAKSLGSRWSLRCLNIRIEGAGDYSILASRKDTYYIAVSAEDSVLASEKQVQRWKACES